MGYSWLIHWKQRRYEMPWPNFARFWHSQFLVVQEMPKLLIWVVSIMVVLSRTDVIGIGPFPCVEWGTRCSTLKEQ
ncbi:hypothetical protein XENTR_v10009817 [Xenopus tropicalis]|nr:hypothetical protein XENTR_v10009817 [Xenopus tropicalis]